MKKKKWLIIGGIIVCIGIVGIIAYLFLGNGSSSSNTVYVTKVSALMSTSSSVNRFSGTVEAQQSVDINLDSNKTVSETYVTVGQSVNAGDKLFSYDVTETSNSLASAQLDIEGYNETISQLNTQIADLQTQLNQTGSSDILVEIQDKQLQIKENQINIEKTQNTISSYQKEIDNSTVTASISGVIKSINETGYDSNGNTAAYMTIEQTGQFRIKGKVDEQSIGVITQGQEVIIRSRVDDTKIWKGTVSSIDTNPETNTNASYSSSGDSASKYPFYVTLETSDGLMLGQHVFIEPDYGQATHTEGVWIDTSYISYDESGEPFVWVSINNKLKKVIIETGEIDEDSYLTEITSGISKEDYIAWPDDSFTEGMSTTSVETIE